MKIGFLSRDITPKIPLPLAGSRYKKDYTQQHSKLEINGIVLKDELNTFVFLTFDLLYVGPIIYSALQEYAYNVYGLLKEHLVLAASHTHFAPATDPQKINLGKVDKAYLDFIIAKAKTVLDSFLSVTDQSKLVDALFHAEPVFHGVCRRAMQRQWRSGFLKKSMSIAPDQQAYFDNKLWVLVLKTASGQRVILWGFACHPTMFPYQTQLGSEFVGFVRDRLRETYQVDTVLYFQGFSGDVRPRCIRKNSTLLEKAEVYLKGGDVFGAFTEQTWHEWAAAIAADVRRGIDQVKKLENFCIKQIVLQEFSWEQLLASHDPALRGKNLQRYKIELGEICFLCVNAEVLSKYARFLPNNVLPVGCINDVVGYLPHYEDIALKGYEVEGFLKSFGLLGDFQKGSLIEPEFAQSWRDIFLNC